MNEQWWKPALLLYAKVTGWIIGPIIVVFFALRYSTVDSILLIAVFFGFAFMVTCYGIWKEIKAYKRSLES